MDSTPVNVYNLSEWMSKHCRNLDGSKPTTESLKKEDSISSIKPPGKK